MVSRPVIILPAISCPACEFERQNCGSPLPITKFHYICAVCSTKWKEFGDAENDCIELIEGSSFAPEIIGQQDYKNGNIGWAKNGKNFIAAFLATSIILGGVLYLFVSQPANISKLDLNTTLNRLVIQGIKIRPAHSAPKSAWIITARVENPTYHSMHVPDIRVQIGTPGNRGYIDHFYKPALQKLQPGANFNLRLAIRKTRARKSQISLVFSDR